MASGQTDFCFPIKELSNDVLKLTEFDVSHTCLRATYDETDNIYIHP